MNTKSILQKIFKLFTLEDIMDKVDKSARKIQDCNTCKINMFKELKKEIEKEKRKRLEDEKMFISVLNHLPDMVWAKGLDGRYIMANKAFRMNFCYGMEWNELQGKTDIEIATIFKEKVGHENHTFGEVCEDSDKIIKETEEARQFLEHGLINGKLMKLVVHKSPMYDLEGTMYAVCGTGRDITEWHDELINAIESSDACFGERGREFLKKAANKYEFTTEN